jgi:two-component system, LytTR family, sensor kinase
LELSALQSQMNPHFIFNSLGAIQYFIQTHDAEKADDYLSNFAKLMRMILESSKSRYITIEDEIELLTLYLGLEQIRFEDKFTFELTVDEELDQDFKIPPMIIQPYIENAINHGLVNLKNKMGELKIIVNNLNNNAIEMIVIDNGIGRVEASKLRNKNHKSRGMQIVNERIESFNESDKFQVTSKIDDLYDENNLAKGTMITLRFIDNN